VWLLRLRNKESIQKVTSLMTSPWKQPVKKKLRFGTNATKQFDKTAASSTFSSTNRYKSLQEEGEDMATSNDKDSEKDSSATESEPSSESKDSSHSSHKNLGSDQLEYKSQSME
jgi:hypothetical protein